jgi:uroporphyrinogen decarboxylase
MEACMMTPRERLLASLKHQEPDRVPIDLGGASATGISAFAYNRLKARLGLPAGKVKIYDLEQMLADVEPEVLKKVGGGAAYLTLPKCPVHDVASWRDWEVGEGLTAIVPEPFKPVKNALGDWEAVKDGRAIWRMPAGGRYFDQVYFPMEDKDSIEDLKEYRPRLASDFELDALEKRAKDLQETGAAVIYHCGSSIFNCAQGLRGHANFMMDLMINKPFAEALIQRILDFRVENMKRCLGRLGKYVDIVECSDDLGTQNGPMISPAVYREMLMPAHAKLFEVIRGYGKYSILHSCGSVCDLIPFFIGSGLDILNPIQLSARGMQPEKLKREFGHDLTFWGGGCDTQKVLPQGTPQEVAEEVKRNTEIFGKGGWFVFAQVHNIQPDVPVENIIAMYGALGVHL